MAFPLPLDGHGTQKLQTGNRNGGIPAYLSGARQDAVRPGGIRLSKTKTILNWKLADLRAGTHIDQACLEFSWIELVTANSWNLWAYVWRIEHYSLDASTPINDQCA